MESKIFQHQKTILLYSYLLSSLISTNIYQVYYLHISYDKKSIVTESAEVPHILFHIISYFEQQSLNGNILILKSYCT